MSAIQRDEDAFLLTTANATNYYYGCGGGDAGLVESIHIQWDAAFAGVFTFEDSNFPEVLLTSTTVGEWCPENPTSGTYVAVTGGGGGTAASGLTVTVVAGAAGCAMVHLGNIGSRRLRGKIVSTTGGRVRVHCHAKQ